MKKTIALLLIVLMALQLFTACADKSGNKKSSDPLVDTWYLIGGEDEPGQQLYQTLLNNQIASVSITFYEDKTGEASMTAFGHEEAMPFTYTIADGRISMVAKGGDQEPLTETSDYRIENGLLYLTLKGAKLIFSNAR